MKKLIFSLLILVVFTSCKKDELVYDKCYNIPSNTTISTLPKIGDSVMVEFATNDGRYGNYSTVINDIKVNKKPRILNNGSTDTLYSTFISIGGTITNGFAYYNSSDQPIIEIVIWEDDKTHKNEVIAIKPSFYGEHMVWNPMNYADIGYDENSKTIYTNGMMSQTSDATMCMKITFE